VAELLGVSPATVKRWEQAGHLNSTRTPGGHRRFRKGDVEVVGPEFFELPAPVTVEDWLASLLGLGSWLALDAALMEARGRQGSWLAVAETLAPVLDQLGRLWQRGEVSVLEEHIAAARLLRALAHSAKRLPIARKAPRALLATAPGEQHALGLALAEVCLREMAIDTIWAGTDVPVADVERSVRNGAVSVVALSASVCANADTLADAARRVGLACTAGGALLLLGGLGPWPEPPPVGEVVRTWEGLRVWFRKHEVVLAPARHPR
jgi:excisionase family DNA binding protein